MSGHLKKHLEKGQRVRGQRKRKKVGRRGIREGEKGRKTKGNKKGKKGRGQGKGEEHGKLEKKGWGW